MSINTYFDTFEPQTISLTSGSASFSNEICLDNMYSWTLQGEFVLPAGITSLEIIFQLSVNGTTFADADTQTITETDNFVYENIGAVYKKGRFQLTSNATEDITLNSNMGRLV